MKQRLIWLLVLVVLWAGAAVPARGDTLDDLLAGFGTDAQQAAQVESILEQIDGELSQDAVLALIAQYFGGEETPQALAGEISEEGVYTDPAGFSFRIPQEWTLQPNLVGPTLVLSGPAEEDASFMPTITLLVVESPQDSFLDMTQEEIDQALGQALDNYVPVLLDDFEFLGLPARELGCMYGADEASMLMQYQLQFRNDTKSYLITLTCLAEEAAYDSALETYDAFLADFQLQEVIPPDPAASPTQAPDAGEYDLDAPDEGGENADGSNG